MVMKTIMLTTSLFSIFDPSLSILSLSWMVSLLVLSLMPCFKWNESLNKNFIKTYLNFFSEELNHSMSKNFKGGTMFISTIFSMIMMYNFLAMFPFVFSMTSHLVVNMPNSLMFWLTIMTFSWWNFMKNFLSHLIPTGTPIFLVSFMVLVELLSNMIRPVALTFRLTANMMAGHLLMSLIGGAAISLPFSMTVATSMIQSMLVIMELGVSLIQAYVFSTLLMLYMSE